MAATFHAKGTDSNFSSTGTATCTLAITAGDSIIVYGSWDSAVATSPVVISVGGAGSETFPVVFGPTTVGQWRYAAWLVQSAVATRTAVNLSWAGTKPFYCEFCATSFTGLTNVVLDQSKVANGTGAGAITSGNTATLSSSDEFAIEFASSADAITANGAPWTDDGTTPTSAWFGHRILSATTAIQSTFTNNSGNWLSYVLTFMSGAAPAVTPTLKVPVSQVVGKFKPWFRQRLFNFDIPPQTVAYTLTAELGTLTLDGKIITLDRTYVMPAGNGALTPAGQVIGLTYGRKMPAGLGTLTLAGQTATLKRNYVMPAGLGTIALTGAAPNLIYSGSGPKSMPGGLGVIPLAGQTVTLRYAHKLVAGTGTLTLAGQVVTTRFAHRTVAGLGTLTLAGQIAVTRYARKMPAGQGTLTPSGQNVTLRYSRKMPAGLGTLTLAGQTVNTIYSGSGSKLLPASMGQLTLAGQPVTLRYTRKMPAAFGTIALAGQTAALQRARKMTATVGSIVLEGKATSLIYDEQAGYTLTAASGVISLTGCDVTMPITRRPPAIVQETLKFGRPVYVSRW